jgi:flavoprotein
MVVAIDQYAALSLAPATRNPVEIAFWVDSRDLLVIFSVASAVMAAAFVLMLDMDVPRSKTEKHGEQAGYTGETDWHHADGENQ